MRPLAPVVLALVVGCGGSRGADPVTVQLSPSRPEALADGTDSIQLTAKVRRGSAVAAAVAVSFSAPPGLVLSHASTETDASGTAMASVSAPAPGTFVVAVTAGGASAQASVRFAETLATALRFASVPSSAVAGEPFAVTVAAEDARGNPKAPPADVTLSVASGPAGVALTTTTAKTANGVASFTATFDRDALGVSLIATAGPLQARSAPIDVRATRDQADWQPVGVEGAFIAQLLASPGDPRTLLAVVFPDFGDLRPQGRLLVTKDGGQTWAKPAANGLPPADPVFAAWCADGSLYVEVLDSGVYRSRDAAATFERMSPTAGIPFCDARGARPFLLRTAPPAGLFRWDGAAFAPLADAPAGFVAAAPDGTNVYATSPSVGVFRSSDAGATWSKTALQATAVSLLAVSADTVLAVGFGGALDRTADGGATWTRLFDKGIVSVARAPKGVLTALDLRGGIRRSSDGGATWTGFVVPLPTQRWVSVAETEAGTWAASGGGVYALDGDAFHLATTGMGGLSTAVYSDPRTGFLYAASEVGLYRFRGGGPWEQVLSRPVQTVTFDPSAAGAMFAGSWDAVMRSIDSGATWSNTPGAPAVPFAAPDGRTWYAENDGLWRSDDAGATWSQLWRWKVGSPHVNAMAFDGDGLVFGSEASSGKVWKGTFRSEDRGATFSPLGISASTRELLRVGSALLVPSEVSRSNDFGRTFAALFPGHTAVTWLASDPGDARVLVALEMEGFGVRPPAMYRSADGGSRWARCRSGLERLRVTQIEIDPTDSSVLYAATNRGLFRSTNVCAGR